MPVFRAPVSGGPTEHATTVAAIDGPALALAITAELEALGAIVRRPAARELEVLRPPTPAESSDDGYVCAGATAIVAALLWYWALVGWVYAAPRFRRLIRERVDAAAERERHDAASRTHEGPFR